MIWTSYVCYVMHDRDITKGDTHISLILFFIKETRRSRDSVAGPYREAPHGLDPHLSHTGLAYRNVAMHTKIVP
jgi:hypothetical protein